MLRLAIATAAFGLLGLGTASADMISGTYFCTADQNQLVWQGGAPAEQFTIGSACGAEGLACNRSASQDFLELAQAKKCETTTFGNSVAFVCTGKANQLKKHIDDLCKEAIAP